VVRSFFAAFAFFAVKIKKKGRMRGAAHVEEFEKMYWKNQRGRFLFP